MADYIKEIRQLVGHRPIRSVSVAALIENEAGELLLQKRSDTNTWGTPGGNLELDEQILDGLKREIKEETGIELVNPTLFGIYSGKDQVFNYPNGDITHYVVIVFYEKLLNHQTVYMNEESMELKYFKKDALPTPIQKTDLVWIADYQTFDFKVKIK